MTAERDNLGLVNGYDLWRVIGLDTPSFKKHPQYSAEYEFLPRYPFAESGYGMPRKGSRNVYADWDAFTKGCGITRWSRSNGQYGQWFPTAVVERIQREGVKLAWKRERRLTEVDPQTGEERFKGWEQLKPTPVAFTEGRPCFDNRCDMVAVSQIETHKPGSVRGERITVWVCKRHNSLNDRKVAKQAEQDERIRVRKEASDRVKQAELAAEEMGQRVIAALQSLDVARAADLVGTDGKGRVTLTIDAADAMLKMIEFMLEMEGL